MVQYILFRGSAQSTVYTVGRCEIYIIIHNFMSICMFVTAWLQHIHYTFLLLRRYSFNVLDESAFHNSLIKGTPVRDGLMTNPLYIIIGIFQQMLMTLEGQSSIKLRWNIISVSLKKENQFYFLLSRWKMQKCKNALHIFSANWLKPSPNQSI